MATINSRVNIDSKGVKVIQSKGELVVETHPKVTKGIINNKIEHFLFI